MKVLMKSMLAVIVGLTLVAGASTAYAVVITDDNYDGYADGDNYIDVNPWGWIAWSTGRNPIVKAGDNVSPENALAEGDSGTSSFNMSNPCDPAITGIDPYITGMEVRVSWYNKFSDPESSGMNVQIGESLNLQDRIYVLIGAAGLPYYMVYEGDGTSQWKTPYLDFGGNPLEVSRGENAVFERVNLWIEWNGTDYGSEYDMQVSDLAGNPLGARQTFHITDSDSRDDGKISYIGSFAFSAYSGSAGRWLDNMYIEAVPEPATLGMGLMGLLMLLRRYKRS